jgi:hypothetical protein
MHKIKIKIDYYKEKPPKTYQILFIGGVCSQVFTDFCFLQGILDLSPAKSKG